MFFSLLFFVFHVSSIPPCNSIEELHDVKIDKVLSRFRKRLEKTESVADVLYVNIQTQVPEHASIQHLSLDFPGDLDIIP